MNSFYQKLFVFDGVYELQQVQFETNCKYLIMLEEMQSSYFPIITIKLYVGMIYPLFMGDNLCT